MDADHDHQIIPITILDIEFEKSTCLKVSELFTFFKFYLAFKLKFQGLSISDQWK